MITHVLTQTIEVYCLFDYRVGEPLAVNQRELVLVLFENVTYHVVKNTMLRLAAKEAGIEGFDAHLEGTTAFAFSTEDAIAPAKVICGFIKKNKLEDNEVLTVKVGTVEGKVIDANEVKALADLPSREELIAKMLGSMNAPISNTVNVLQGVIRNAVYVLDAVRAQKESA